MQVTISRTLRIFPTFVVVTKSSTNANYHLDIVTMETRKQLKTKVLATSESAPIKMIKIKLSLFSVVATSESVKTKSLSD